MGNFTNSIQNRTARYNYEILERYIAGIVLLGPEVVSVRVGKANISEAFCMIENGQLIIKNLYITRPDTTAAFDTFSETRDRVLLMNKSEINSLFKKVSIKGNTLIPLKIFRNQKGLFKVELGLCKGKKDYDKRETIKERDTKKDIERALKNY